MFNVAYEKIGVAGSILVPMATANEKQFRVDTNSARWSSVSELGSLTVRKSKKCLRARRPSPLEITV